MAPNPIAARDAGLGRLSRITRRLLAAGMVLTAGFSALAARSFPGRTAQQAVTTPSPQPATDSSSSVTTSPPSSADEGSSQLSPPVTSVQPSGRRSRVTSGAS